MTDSSNLIRPGLRGLVLLLALAFPSLLHAQDDDIEHLEARLEIATSRERLEALHRLSAAYLGRRDFQSALERGERAEGLARELRDKAGLAVALRLQGDVYRTRNENGPALVHYREAIPICQEIGDFKELSRTLYHTAVSYWLLSDHARSLDYSFRAYEAAQQADDPVATASALNMAGLVYSSLEQYSQSLDYYLQVLGILEQLGNESSMGRVLNNIGNVYRKQGDLTQALEYYQRSLAMKKKVGDEERFPSTLSNLGVTYQGLGDLDQALRYFRLALAGWEEIGDKKEIASTLYRLGGVHRVRDDIASASAALERCLALATEISSRSEAASCQEGLAELYAQTGRFEEALAAFREYEKTQREIFNEENSHQIAKLETRFEVDRKENEIELLKKGQALAALELERQRESRRSLFVGFGLVLGMLLLIFNRYRLNARASWMREAMEQERLVSLRLREIDRLKDDFLANTSHELRTPLFGMVGLAESLRDGATGELPAATREHLSMIIASGRRLGQLVDDILDFSKLRRHSLDLKRSAIDLHSAVEVVLALLRPLVADRELDLINAVPVQLPLVEADENRLLQILHNVIDSAIRFTADGTVEVSAGVEEEERVVIRVADTGIGIAEERLDRIFEPFEQAETSIERNPGGTGLGLAVARQLVELHGGQIKVESVVGRGSTFSVSLPLARDANVSGAALAAETMPRAAAIEPIVATTSQERSQPEDTSDHVGARILIVDDEPVNRLLLRNYLSLESYRTIEAASGPEAVSLLAAQEFDLVLLDVMMPKMSGYEVCRILRENHARSELPVVFLTAKAQVSDLVAGLSAGGNDYLTKPIAKDELLARVRTQLELLGAHRNLRILIRERTAQIEERDRLLRERERLIEELEARNAELAQFNYTVAHDLRTPLCTVKNFVGLARRDAATGRSLHLARDFDRLERAADLMERLLDELFELSRVGVHSNPAEDVSFRDLVQEALEGLSEPLAARCFKVDVANGLPVVRGDRTRFLQAVRHLLDNAVSYVGDQVRPHLEVGVRQDGSEQVFYVRDNGRGIDPRYHEKIFGLFERLEPEASEGTGLGLALVKRIVEVHGGSVWVESRGVGCGSTFCWKLAGSARREPMKCNGI